LLAAGALAWGLALASPSSAQSGGICPPGYTHSTGINDIDQCIKDGAVSAQYPVTAWRAYYSANPGEVAKLSGAEIVNAITLGRITSSHIPIYSPGRAVTLSVPGPTTDQRRAPRCSSQLYGSSGGGSLTGEGLNCSDSPAGYASGSTRAYSTVYGPCNGPYTLTVGSNMAEASGNRVRVTETAPGRASIPVAWVGRQQVTYIDRHSDGRTTETFPCTIIMPDRQVVFRAQRKSGVSSSVARFVAHDSAESTPRGCVIVVVPHSTGFSRTHCMSAADVAHYEANQRARGSDVDVGSLPECSYIGSPSSSCKATN